MPPARVLRRTAEPPPLRFGLVCRCSRSRRCSRCCIWLVRDTQARRRRLRRRLGRRRRLLPRRGLGLVRADRPLRGGVGVAWRYGLANISRRGRDSVVQSSPSASGFMVLLLLALVRDDLLARLAREPAQRRAELLPDQHPPGRGRAAARARSSRAHGVDLRRLCRWCAHGSRRSTAAGRHAAFRQSDRGRGFVEREANLTWSRTLRADNASSPARGGRADGHGKPAGVGSTDYRDALHLKLGDELSFDVAGRALTRARRERAQGALGQLPGRTSSSSFRRTCSTV